MLEKDVMKIEGSGNLGREIRQLAGAVDARRQSAEGDLDQGRLANLGELLLISADIADEIDGLQVHRELPSDVAAEWFNDIIYREFPDGPASDGI